MLSASKITNLAVVFLVGDLNRTLAFYSGTLGLAFEVDDVAAGHLLARLPGNVELVFFQGEAPRGGSPQIVFGLAEGGIESLAEALAARGVELVTPVSEAPGGWSVEFRDPDGHLLSLYQDGALPKRR
ncbi:MAG: VOC family protein [Labilithrix sp.]|nr:VOC family protein [Labilithrix sp.]MCW5836810.1 VOC family protein [Labilithrix sp.]